MTEAGAPYADATRPIPERVADLISQMTPAEKVGQMLQLPTWSDPAPLIADYDLGSILHTDPSVIDAAIDAAAASRLGIPLLIADDCIRGHSFWPGATLFPSQLAQGCSWNVDLIEAAARATAAEVASTGIVWTFSPVLCIARDPRWGRVDETFGEDPLLIGELAAAMIRGYQGEGLDDPSAILACAKHFAGYSETQGGRDASEADVSRRKLRSWFLPPFERAVREGCRTFMLGYQSMDGVPVTLNEWLLSQVLKGEWGFTGLLVTDWDNVGRMVWEQKVSPDAADAAARAVAAGNDLIMSTADFRDGALEALAAGRIDEAQLDEAVARILTVKFELGLFEDPRRPSPQRQAEVIGCDAHRGVNRALNDESFVLLRNEGVLPLSTQESVKTIAVVGPNADAPQSQLGDWAAASGQAPWAAEPTREEVVTVLRGLREAVPADWQVTHALGAQITHTVPDPAGATFPDGQPRPPIVRPADADEALLAEAEAVARAADVVVAVVGDDINLTGEGKSTATLELVGGQRELLRRLAATGTPLVVVLVNSKPLVLPPEALEADALIEAFNPGLEGGHSIAAAILGEIEPAGRLPITVPRHAGQLPVYYNQIRGQHGDRYADLTQEPQFPFGFGLSYSRVEYADLSLDQSSVALDGTVTAHITVRNVGERPCREVVQLYVRDLVTSVTWADKELKTFARVDLAPGEEKRVELSVPVAELTLVDADGVRVVEPGDVEILVGPDSSDARLLASTVTVTA